MRANGALVRVDLTQQQRLDKPPGGDERVKIFHRATQFERAQHVPIDIDITVEVCITDLAFVDASDRTQPLAVFYCYAEARCIGPEMLRALVGQNDVERYRRS